MDINIFLQTEGYKGNLMLVMFLHFSPFNLLPATFLFFYVRNTLTDRNHLTLSDLLHFIPFLIVAIDFIPYYQLPMEDKRRIIEQVSGDMNAIMAVAQGRVLSHFQYSMLRWTLWFIYLLAILRMLYIRRPKALLKPKMPLSQYRTTYNWLLTLTLFFLAALIPFLKLILDYHSGKVIVSGASYIATPAFMMSMAISVMACFSILMYPQILYGMPRVSVTLPEVTIEKEVPPQSLFQDPPVSNEAEFRSDPTDQDPFIRLADAIEQYIRDEKPYLDPDFSISTISHRFKVPQHHVHFCFSKIIQCGFPAYRNRLRVANAKELLTGIHGRTLTIDAIGKESGFSAKKNFYNAFNKETGMTPGQYLESLAAGKHPDQT